MLKVTQII